MLFGNLDALKAILWLKKCTEWFSAAKRKTKIRKLYNNLWCRVGHPSSFTPWECVSALFTSMSERRFTETASYSCLHHLLMSWYRCLRSRPRESLNGCMRMPNLNQKKRHLPSGGAFWLVTTSRLNRARSVIKRDIFGTYRDICKRIGLRNALIASNNLQELRRVPSEA